jgi:hypothetical protein
MLTDTASVNRSTKLFIGLVLVSSVLFGPVTGQTIARRHGKGHESGLCMAYHRSYPGGSTIACTVQPGPDKFCRHLLGLTVKLWTCRNGEWVISR